MAEQPDVNERLRDVWTIIAEHTDATTTRLLLLTSKTIYAEFKPSSLAAIAIRLFGVDAVSRVFGRTNNLLLMGEVLLQSCSLLGSDFDVTRKYSLSRRWFRAACCLGDVNIVDHMLQSFTLLVDLEALKAAAGGGNTDVIKLMLDSVTDTDAFVELWSGVAFFAANNSQKAVLQALLGMKNSPFAAGQPRSSFSHSDVHGPSHQGEAVFAHMLFWAVTRGDADIITVLLSDERVDGRKVNLETACDQVSFDLLRPCHEMTVTNASLSAAVKAGNLPYVTALLAEWTDKDPLLLVNDALLQSATGFSFFNPVIFRMLLSQHPALHWAVSADNATPTKQILQRILGRKFACRSSSPVAVNEGLVLEEVLRLQLDDARLAIPSDAILIGVQSAQVDPLRILLQNSRVRTASKPVPQDIIRAAFSLGDWGVSLVELLLQDRYFGEDLDACRVLVEIAAGKDDYQRVVATARQHLMLQ